MGYKESDYQTKQHNLSNMAQFGMSQEHKDMLRKNRVFLIEELDPEPIIQRLFQINMIPKAILEDIQALPTNYHKCIALLDQLPKRGPKAFQNFCRILSAVGQPHIRSKIQPEGAKWCVDLRTVITYDGITLGLHKYYQCEKHASPPGLEPGSLDYRSNVLTTKLRRHNEETCSSHPSTRG